MSVFRKNRIILVGLVIHLLTPALAYGSDFERWKAKLPASCTSPSSKEKLDSTTLVKALAATSSADLKIETKEDMVSLANSILIVSRSFQRWNPNFDQKQILSALNQEQTGENAVRSQIINPALDLINTAYGTLPQAAARSVSNILNAALVGANPQVASLLCTHLDIGVHQFNAKDFESPLGLNGAVDAAFAAVPQIRDALRHTEPTSVKVLHDMTKSPDLNSVLFGRGSAFEGRTQPDYGAVMAGTKTIDGSVKGAAGAPMSKDAGSSSSTSQTTNKTSGKSTTECNVCVLRVTAETVGSAFLVGPEALIALPGVLLSCKGSCGSDGIDKIVADAWDKRNGPAKNNTDAKEDPTKPKQDPVKPQDNSDKAQPNNEDDKKKKEAEEKKKREEGGKNGKGNGNASGTRRQDEDSGESPKQMSKEETQKLMSCIRTEKQPTVDKEVECGKIRKKLLGDVAAKTGQDGPQFPEATAVQSANQSAGAKLGSDLMNEPAAWQQIPSATQQQIRRYIQSQGGR